MVPSRTFHCRTSVNIDPSSCGLSTLNQFMCEMHWLTGTVALHVRDVTWAQQIKKSFLNRQFSIFLKTLCSYSFLISCDLRSKQILLSFGLAKLSMPNSASYFTTYAYGHYGHLSALQELFKLKVISGMTMKIDSCWRMVLISLCLAVNQNRAAATAQGWSTHTLQPIGCRFKPHWELFLFSWSFTGRQRCSIIDFPDKRKGCIAEQLETKQVQKSLH